MRLNNHRKDVNNPKVKPVCHYFKAHGDKFMKHANFTVTEELSKTSYVGKATLRLRLKGQQIFLINKLKTFAHKGLNQELNNV